MNHLAHLLLAEPTPASRLGNLAADYLRPKEVEELPADVRRGVMQHRAVDGFTDRHPVVCRALGRLPDHWGWFKGIVVDVYFDFLLAEAWAEHEVTPLRDFVDELNRDLTAAAGATPDVFDDVTRIVRGDRLYSYRELPGIEAALRRISGIIAERMPTRAVDLTLALPDLAAVHPALTADFREFFPQLRRFSANWLAAAPAGPGRP